MEEKINFRFLFIGLLSILLTAISITLVFHTAFQEQVKEDLQNSAGIIAKNDDFLTDPNLLAVYASDKMRITLIAPSGQIQYESSADESQMENHLSRPEIQSALQNGFGEAMHIGIRYLLLCAAPAKWQYPAGVHANSQHVLHF